MEMLASVADLRLWLQNPDFDERAATTILTAASGVIRDATGQTISRVDDDTITLDGCGGQFMDLPQRPVIAVHTVAVNGTEQSPTSYSVVGGRIYRQWGLHGFVANASEYWGHTYQITVTYDHGYDRVPDGVRAAVLAMAADIASNPGGLMSESIDDYTWRRSETPEGQAADLMLKSVIRRYGTSSRTLRLGYRR